MSKPIDKIYTKKQQEIYRDTQSKDWFILINHGAVRSGKTVLNNDLFLKELLRVRKIADKKGILVPQYILAGASLGTIEKNILTELFNRYGIEVKFDKFNSFMLFGVKVVQVGHATIGGKSSIRGMTAYGAYVNEGSLANEEVFNEIIARCSGDGARILVDTNPDNPNHWLKKNYIDNKSEGILEYKFTIDDNSFLSDRYKANLKASTPSGMFYDRTINGLWVSGDGSVYKDFKEDVHYIAEKDINKMNIKKYIVGVDWGFEHYGTMVIIGVTDNNKYIVLKEYAYQHKYIDWWTDLALKIINKYGNIPFYVDTARSDNNKYFEDKGIYVIGGNKKVIAGIQYIGGLIKSNRFFVIKNNVDKFKEEIYSYVWNDKTFKDDVKKENDDVLDAIRYAIYTDALINYEI